MLIFRVFLAICLLLSGVVQAESVRLKDLGRIDGWRDNALVGYGLVTGLAGTGDSSRNRATRQSIANMLGQHNLHISSDQILSRNAAVVMVTANLKPFAREGDKLDVTVTSMGDARSLLGGSLLLTPLKGPNNRTYILAQGAISIGGYKYDQNGNVAQKNHPTVGVIPDGGTVEVPVATELLAPDGSVSFVLTQPDFTTASRVAEAVNLALRSDVASVADAASIRIALEQPQRDRLSSILAMLENLTIQPDVRARVVVNERTGVIVAGGDVRISKVSIAQGDLKVSVVTENLVSQPIFVRQTGPGVRTEVVPNTRIEVTESAGTGVAIRGGDTVADLVQALNRLKVGTRDIIAVLQAVKAAGAMHGELIIQ